MPPTYDFKRKFALLDTNILKEMTQKTKRSDAFRPVFEFLKENECEIFIIDVTSFEFIGYSTNKKDYNKVKDYLKNFTIVPYNKDDLNVAAELSAMYKCKNPSISPKQISLVDCLYAAQITRYKERAFIVTTDLNDYPSFLFDMPKYIPIEEGDGNTAFVAFKTYNEKKLNSLRENFEKTDGSEE